jgi:hypothetical protein
MLTQLSTVKARLAIPDTDTQFDALLTGAIQAVSARFDNETRRTLARSVNLCQEFPAEDTEIAATCYPIETVTRFELKTNETDGWVEQPGVQFIIRRACVISLASPLSPPPSSLSASRVTYTGGYLLPGSADVPLATRLPSDLEQAAVEQVVYWYQNRDKVGVIRLWPKGGVYEQFLDLDLLPSVRAVLRKYERWGG